MGFIAILGVVALAGMIIRNSVILVDQIEHERGRGVDPWDAVINASMIGRNLCLVSRQPRRSSA